MGIDIDQLVPQEARQTAPVDYDVWPEHWDAVNVFLMCANGGSWNWITGLGFARRAGLDLSAVDRAMGWRNIPRKRQWEVAQQIKLMEAEALEIFDQAR